VNWGSTWPCDRFRSWPTSDKQLSPPDLLSAAFGPAEGGMIHRAGLNAIESATRDIVMLLPELSNPE
jgi:hypothetical protein